MHPVLLKLGPFTIYAYGVAMVAAFLAAVGLTARRLRSLSVAERPLPPEQVTDLCLAALVGGVIGGRLFYVAAAWEYFQTYPLEVFALWHGGLVWYGGLLGGLLGGGGYVRRRGWRLLPVLDLLSPAMALAHGIGRVGCFLNGCCYGVPTAAWYGVRFPGHETAVVPTQLLEAGGLGLLAAGLWAAQRRMRLGSGRLFGAYLIGYALLRAALELWRGDQPRFAGWTLPQYISLLLLAAGFLLWLRPWRARTISR